MAFVSGGAAALGSSFVKVPLAVCIRSVQAGVYPNVFAAASSIVKAAGYRGLFTGYAPTVLEDVPDMAIKFAVYEALRNAHTAMAGGRAASPQEDFAMGAVSGALAAACTTPLDVIKTNMMCTAASRPSMRGASAMVFAQGGFPAFFRGVGTRALSNGINSAVFFAWFSVLSRELKAKSEAWAAEDAAEAAAGAAEADARRRRAAAEPQYALLGAAAADGGLAGLSVGVHSSGPRGSQLALASAASAAVAAQMASLKKSHYGSSTGSA